MKKRILFLMTIGFFFSCSDDNQDNSETKLIGNWKLIEILGDQEMVVEHFILSKVVKQSNLKMMALLQQTVLCATHTRTK
jgi:hypothetical protein